MKKLSGVFEVRIYPVDYSYKTIVERARVGSKDMNNYELGIVNGVDMRMVNMILDRLDNVKMRKRRNLYAKVYNEAMVSQEPGKGISFTGMLFLLAHHKLIDDREALV